MIGIIIWLVIGGIVGWLASLIMRTDAQQGILLNIVVGIVGAFIGGLIFNRRHDQRRAAQRRRRSSSRWSARSSCSRSSTCSGAAASASRVRRSTKGPLPTGRPFFIRSSKLTVRLTASVCSPGVDLGVVGGVVRRCIRIIGIGGIGAAPASLTASDPLHPHAERRAHRARPAPAPWRRRASAPRRAPPRAARCPSIGPLIWFAPCGDQRVEDRARSWRCRGSGR